MLLQEERPIGTVGDVAALSKSKFLKLSSHFGDKLGFYLIIFALAASWNFMGCSYLYMLHEYRYVLPVNTNPSLFQSSTTPHSFNQPSNKCIVLQLMMGLHNKPIIN